MDTDSPDDDSELIELIGDLEPHAAEALRLELRRLARRHGVEITDLRVDRDSGERADG